MLVALVATRPPELDANSPIGRRGLQHPRQRRQREVAIALGIRTGDQIGCVFHSEDRIAFAHHVGNDPRPGNRMPLRIRDAHRNRRGMTRRVHAQDLRRALLWHRESEFPLAPVRQHGTQLPRAVCDFRKVKCAVRVADHGRRCTSIFPDRWLWIDTARRGLAHHIGTRHRLELRVDDDPIDGRNVALRGIDEALGTMRIGPRGRSAQHAARPTHNARDAGNANQMKGQVP
jgi:hypothetical protein